MRSQPADEEPANSHRTGPRPERVSPAEARERATLVWGFLAALSVVQAAEAAGVSTLDSFERAAVHCQRSGIPADAVRAEIERGLAEGLGGSELLTGTGTTMGFLEPLKDLLGKSIDRIYRA
ncbi:hypothetical protein [Nocardia sp. NPDC050406]|uniref:hypothetical protein n=1 Tax=Nocardia sp. NPDC050406 TaxID=3364318 RepID=UPI00378F7765